MTTKRNQIKQFFKSNMNNNWSEETKDQIANKITEDIYRNFKNPESLFEPEQGVHKNESIKQTNSQTASDH